MSTAVPSSCTVSTGPPYLQLVPVCTIFIVKGLHHRKHLAAGLALCHPTQHTSQFLVCPLNTSGPNHGPHSTFVVTQVFKYGYGKEEDEPYALVSKELAGWIGMATCTWQVADTTLTQPC